jgi:hypothetical protein
MLGHSGNVIHNKMGNGESHDEDIELKGNSALDIHEDALVITYLQVGEVFVGLAPKEQDCVMHRSKWFRWEDNSLLWVWIDGQVRVVPCPK